MNLNYQRFSNNTTSKTNCWPPLFRNLHPCLLFFAGEFGLPEDTSETLHLAYPQVIWFYTEKRGKHLRELWSLRLVQAEARFLSAVASILNTWSKGCSIRMVVWGQVPRYTVVCKISCLDGWGMATYICQQGQL